MLDQDDLAGLPGLQPRDPLALRDDGEHDGVGLVVIVADELGGGPLLGDLGYGTAERAPRVVLDRGPSTFALLLHGRRERVDVHGNALLGGDLGGEFEGEPVGVVEREGSRAVERGTARPGKSGEFGLEEADTLAKGRAETVFLAGDDAVDELAVFDDLGIGRAHELDHAVDEAHEERVLDAEQPPVTHRPAQEAPQNVAAAFVARDDAVCDEERHGPGVIGDDAHRGIRLLTGPVVGTGDLLGERHERAKDVGLEVRRDALEDRGDALESHTGVDARLGQRVQGAVFGAVVLHEHEVPVLQIAVAVAADGAVRAVAPEFGTLVVVELGARPARTGRPRRPEVVLGAHAHDALLREADFIDPDRLGLVVVLEDRDPDAVGIESEHVDRVLPGPRGRFGLEVVAETEVAEHLEEGVMASGGADDIDVGRPNAFLDGRGPREPEALGTEEHRLELNHPGRSEQQGRIVRNQR